MLKLELNNNEITIYDSDAFIQLEFLFQPIVDLKTKKIKHLEILSKVLSESGETYNNEEFFSNADDEFIKLVSLHQLKYCSIKKIRVPVTINLTLSCLEDRSFLRKITELKEVNFGIEITEINCDLRSLRLNNNFKFLKRHNINLFLDDYFHKNDAANLTLGFIDWDYIKIDKSFLYYNFDDVRSLDHLMSVISPYANKYLILEGVETALQHEALRNFDVLVQGFYYSPPQSWDEINKLFLLNKNSSYDKNKKITEQH